MFETPECCPETGTEIVDCEFMWTCVDVCGHVENVRFLNDRKFIGGTPEQWDESKPIDEDPDASADLQPILVSEQVCAFV